MFRHSSLVSSSGVLSFLTKILSPVVGNTENTVKNSCHFAEFVRGKTLKADQVLASFDVISLFTNIYNGIGTI